jgi:hypothetical protein
MVKRKIYSLYKIPGRRGAIPDRVLKSGSVEKLLPYLITQRDSVALPAVSNSAFQKSFQQVCGAFLDASWMSAIANKRIWKDRGVWFIYSLGSPCWVLIEKRGK